MDNSMTLEQLIKQGLKPTTEVIEQANITHFMRDMGFDDIAAFHRWSVNNFEDFWFKIIKQLKINFKTNPMRMCDLSHGVIAPQWLPGAKINIADSCFNAPENAIAVICKDENKLVSLTYAELNRLSNRIANSLIAAGFKSDDAIAIIMPMNINAVAIYLGIIKMGGVVVSIADSFSSTEIALRLKIGKVKAIFTQDYLTWGGKLLPLYEKIKSASDTKIILLPHISDTQLKLREQDLSWEDFLSTHNQFVSQAMNPMSACNILFSSGTTGEPKAILWNHTTPIKVASDAFFHQDIQPNDVLTWPSNLGWMMGPWLVFAALMNHATVALYPDAPKDRAFGEFIRDARVTMLGVVPTLVAHWRQTKCMEGLDFSAIKIFSSTGECSNAEDMAYLMSIANFKPVIEYCGGTEIGGAYVTSTVVQTNFPSLFSTQAMGMDFVLLDEEGHLANQGEVAIIPPSIGLSTQLLNADHTQIYYANMPTDQGKILRRHGDEAKRLANGYYSLLGRVDDTMNLGGIKIGAAEIERALSGMENIMEVAAIASMPSKGPSQLIIVAVTQTQLDKNAVIQAMQQRINAALNPLFKIQDVMFVTELPKTASNKIMRRMLRGK